MPDNMIAVLVIIVFPFLFGWIIPTIIMHCVKLYKESHTCKHLHTEWRSELPSKFLCISGNRKICVCKDCGEIVDDIFYEYEGMGYK